MPSTLCEWWEHLLHLASRREARLKAKSEATEEKLRSLVFVSSQRGEEEWAALSYDARRKAACTNGAAHSTRAMRLSSIYVCNDNVETHPSQVSLA